MGLNRREIKFRVWVDWVSDKFMDYNFAFDDYGELNEQLAEIPNLMQFTGMKDKNGKEIYEGDCFDAKLGNVFMVYYNEQHARFSVEVIRNSGKMVGILKPNISDLKNMEVIGNIYENPELLK